MLGAQARLPCSSPLIVNLRLRAIEKEQHALRYLRETVRRRRNNFRDATNTNELAVRQLGVSKLHTNISHFSIEIFALEMFY